VPVSVVVLAAGQGKRMHSALPKVLQPLAGRPMLAHVLATARALEPAAIHVVYGHGGDEVKSAFAGEGDLRWDRQAEQLGTGHALMQALPSIPDDHRVLVLFGDVPLVRPATLERLLEASATGDLALLTVALGDPTGYGRVIRDGRGAVARVVEHKDASDDERRVSEINTGLMAFAAKPLRGFLAKLGNDNAQGEYYLTDVIGLAVKAGTKVQGIRLESPDEVLGINDRVQLAAAERVLQRSIVRDLMIRGATFADPERVDVRGSLSIGRDVFVDVGAVFRGKVELGDGVRIEPYCVITDSALGAGTVVHAHSVIEGVATGADCEIGPFARLRPGAELASDVKIGNFVEVKKSKIGEHSKANHLSYIGDATIGSGVNVGAGTITCNYDGANKHRTTIGNDVFVGSGVMLVAPVTIGDGATIGAGSTITKDAPVGELTLERSKQTSIPGWQRPKKKPK
jgi:bifunctional UDP-N-acetylglucosamine pyrophosphorylase/glucosamine-1-phosphate N-acetyltransferase